jgi:hypothetical protein
VPPTHTPIIRKNNIEEGFLSIPPLHSLVKGAKAWSLKKVVGSHKAALLERRV